jgi:hypothetical protein
MLIVRYEFAIFIFIIYNNNNIYIYIYIYISAFIDNMFFDVRSLTAFEK